MSSWASQKTRNSFQKSKKTHYNRLFLQSLHSTPRPQQNKHWVLSHSHNPKNKNKDKTENPTPCPNNEWPISPKNMNWAHITENKKIHPKNQTKHLETKGKWKGSGANCRKIWKIHENTMKTMWNSLWVMAHMLHHHWRLNPWCLVLKRERRRESLVTSWAFTFLECCSRFQAFLQDRE